MKYLFYTTHYCKKKKGNCGFIMQPCTIQSRLHFPQGRTNMEKEEKHNPAHTVVVHSSVILGQNPNLGTTVPRSLSQYYRCESGTLSAGWSEQKQHALLYKQVQLEMLYCTRHCCMMCSEQKKHSLLYKHVQCINVVRDIIERSRRKCSEQKNMHCCTNTYGRDVVRDILGIFFLTSYCTAVSYWDRTQIWELLYPGPCRSTTGVSRERSLQDEAEKKTCAAVQTSTVRDVVLYATLLQDV